MALVHPGELIAEAPRGGAIAAFNFITFEQLLAFRGAAEQASAGMILQLSENAIRYHGGVDVPLAAALAAARSSPVPIAVQLDHVTDLALAERGASLGATSVMFDASRLADAENRSATAEAARRLHRLGVWVEAELGEVGGKDGVHSATARTDPSDAAAFVEQTDVDGLAVAVGSSHAMTGTGARLDLPLIGALAAAVEVPLVLHGSSGIDDQQLRSACRAGIAKVNVGTRFNVILTREARNALAADPNQSDPRRYLLQARTAVEAEARRLIELLR